MAKQASARHFWVFLFTNSLFDRFAKEGRKIGEFRDNKCSKTTPHPVESDIVYIFHG